METGIGLLIDNVCTVQSLAAKTYTFPTACTLLFTDMQPFFGWLPDRLSKTPVKLIYRYGLPPPVNRQIVETTKSWRTTKKTQKHTTVPQISNLHLKPNTLQFFIPFSPIFPRKHPP
jgi:hypothetical protein